ncbi:General substrate transporter [Macleaya cordata]|uniref:General substrate transporter n=1 Tax=Macleaya cordata TaxID=56857 RepID=A0A200QNN3_MACCD|nr:General substrate transporter [Macleaya cordata]
MEVLNKLAKLNKKKLPKNLTILNHSMAEANKLRSNKSLWSARWARRILTIVIAGFGIGFVYYGIQLNVENLNFNLYSTVIINVIMEIPAVFIGSILLSIMDRQRIIPIICNPGEEGKGKNKSSGSWGQLTAEAVGFMAVTISFDVLYVYCVELFPTNLRNFALSMLRQALMLGASLAPLLVVLGRSSPSISFLIFGGLAIFSRILMLWLPETRNAPLYETLEQQEEEET